MRNTVKQSRKQNYTGMVFYNDNNKVFRLCDVEIEGMS